MEFVFYVALGVQLIEILFFIQTMIERLLLMLNDSDYRVRFVLARQIGILFQTWDGHEALFQDIW